MGVESKKGGFLCEASPGAVEARPAVGHATRRPTSSHLRPDPEAKQWSKYTRSEGALVPFLCRCRLRGTAGLGRACRGCCCCARPASTGGGSEGRATGCLLTNTFGQHAQATSVHESSSMPPTSLVRQTRQRQHILRRRPLAAARPSDRDPARHHPAGRPRA
jgi:hypothetical protein